MKRPWKTLNFWGLLVQEPCFLIGPGAWLTLVKISSHLIRSACKIWLSRVIPYGHRFGSQTSLWTPRKHAAPPHVTMPIFLFCIRWCELTYGDSFLSVLWHCWLGDRKGIRPVKNWMLVCWWWWFDWRFAWLIATVVTTTSIILCFNKHRLTQVHLENGRENGVREYGDLSEKNSPLASHLLRSLKSTGNDTDWSATYDFLFLIRSNHGPISYCFRDKRCFWSNIANSSYLPCI